MNANEALIADKAAHLLAQLDLSRPELAGVTTADEYIAFLAGPSRPRFRVEYLRKAEILTFLRAHYAAWQGYDTAPADRFLDLPIAAAQGLRALAGVPALGRAWWATGDPKYGAAFERFYLAVPTGAMFNWAEFNGLQAAIELDAFFLLLDCPGFSTEGRIAYLDHLVTITADAWDSQISRWQQIWLGPEGHNWYLHGMHILPFAGTLFPEWARAAFYLRTGMSVVEEHVRSHLKRDGGARETIMGYQAYSMCNLWDFYQNALRNGVPLPPDFLSRILDGTKFVLRMMTPLGALPSFGDDGSYGPGYLTHLAAVATALSGDGECKWYAEQARRHQRVPAEAPGVIPLCAFWDVGLAGAATYADTRAVDPRHVSVLMGDTGYAALRDGDRSLTIAAADRGPIVTSHGHNDVFSLDLTAHGVRFLGEMGNAQYGESPARDYDLRTEAHTCLTIAGQEQAPIATEWRWRGHVIPQVRRWISESSHDFFHGVHEGFYHYPEQITLHARKVIFLKGNPSYWVVFDWVESTVEHDYRIYFHGAAPGHTEGTSIFLGNDPRLAIVPPAEDRLTLDRVTDAGRTAFLAEKELPTDACPAFVYSQRSGSTCFVWVLAPLEKGVPPPVVRRLPVTVNGGLADARAAVALEVVFPGHRDLLAVSHLDYDAELSFAGVTAWGFFVVRRLRDAETILAVEHRMRDGVCGR